MRQAIGEVLALAIAAAISPFPIIGVVLMLVTPRARTNGPMFVLGWLGGLAIVGTIGLSLAGAAGASDDGEPSAGANLLQVALGAALIALAVRYWRKRPRHGEQPELPAWMNAADRLSPVQAAGTGILMSAVNPKNLVLTLAAATTIAATGLPAGDQVLVYAVYVLLASAGVATPVIIFFLLGERSATMLQALKTWLGHNNATIMAVVLLLIGTSVLGQGIAG